MVGGTGPNRSISPMNGPPTLARLLFDWQFDFVFGTAALLLAALYLVGLRRLRTPWPVARTVVWLAGCAVLLVATSSGIGRYAHAVFGVHMTGQLLLAVVVPSLLVLGGPFLLLIRTLPPGPRARLTSLLRSPACRVLTRPGVSYGLLAGPLYLLYYAGVFSSVVSHQWAQPMIDGYFVIAGFLFFWPVIGVDPAPRRLPPAGRMLMMFALLPAFGFLAVVLSNMDTPLGAEYYASLDLPWRPDLLAAHALGGTAVWAFGELPALVLLIATAVQWANSDDRAAAHRAATTDETDLAAYNAMLTDLDRRR